ncbi:hypothetical protein SNE40_023075 [Patella caerulea]|uniref:Uncharacterized protein n=1 Tax=Patella caerulea TaxID=87958 RepID=A0AAN8G232_PATCE
MNCEPEVKGGTKMRKISMGKCERVRYKNPKCGISETTSDRIQFLDDYRRRKVLSITAVTEEFLKKRIDIDYSETTPDPTFQPLPHLFQFSLVVLLQGLKLINTALDLDSSVKMLDLGLFQ